MRTFEDEGNTLIALVFFPSIYIVFELVTPPKWFS